MTTTGGMRSRAPTAAKLEAIILSLKDDAAYEEVERWLVGPEADAAQPSREYVAITCLIMAADHARLRLAEPRQASSTAVGERPEFRPEDLAMRSVAGDDQVPTWPLAMLNALRLGRRLVAEVPARPGRRAFVDITPVGDDRDHFAAGEGWQRSDPNRSFRLEHWDYDEGQISGWDYDIGAERVRTGAAANEAALRELIAAWGLRPADFDYPWNTADPQ